MIRLLCFTLAVLASPFKSKLRLEAENAMLRHQLNVLRRKLHGHVRLTNNDRWFFVQLYRWFPSGTFETCRWPLTKSVMEGKADFPVAHPDFSV
jgi:hypothetical protein